ncbi:MAG TPA: geranylgeranylglyceryl/heptaprenylglyceryl phosphate synthase [Flavobacteriales bacterium]|nr:geranylgeranylglyceryl/heptaprenylglyceryl phosphate synthase [Flavobacteriales bacterium]HQV52158.1 geranylgeranylglyceryl/heptaprenylglyceryl phosphate synthase [Flavobacteriales bacterium]HQX30937.1 geranylgeranylglyceryl/heptaprenylglyceryl phosphate synthase [Flavobacteriales bacterium]HQX39211.1 geranylgeranylglyceryl/heptaprenylglyceryl phosphate synthase [Flavobacteriales bacterium]HQZ41566.1 geranylgeranylglyceryl/heptaprenylglyceryl phosphate synthase [Flavobacteriales bacterium]
MESVIQHIVSAKNTGRKLLAVLIDPDFGQDEARLERTVQNACMAKADLLFVGGSLLTSAAFNRCVELVKQWSDRPVVLFPGSPAQLSKHADAVLLLSLISGRNPELLIGHHVTAAPTLKAMGIETIPTGYMLVDGGKPTTVSYVSQTLPIPRDKPGIAACTALAGEMLGLRTIYMDTGSGAEFTVSPEMIAAVRNSVDLPIIIGGGIRDAKTARALCTAGADVLVIGTAFEEDPERIFEMREAVA